MKLALLEGFAGLDHSCASRDNVIKVEQPGELIVCSCEMVSRALSPSRPR